jgi:hypothetical protein
VFSTESAKDYLKEMQTPTGTINSQKLRVKEGQSTQLTQIQTKVTQEESISMKGTDTEPEDKSLVYVLYICEVNNFSYNC